MHININTYALALFLHQEFKQIGKEKTLGSFTIEELDDLSNHIEAVIKKAAEEDEPPF